MSRVLVLSLTDLARDPRVDRQIGFLRDTHEVIAAGLAAPADRDIEFIDLNAPPRVRAHEIVRQFRSLARLVTRRSESVYWQHPANRIALERLKGHRADVVIANDLSALPLACRAANGARVVFDAHELSVEEHADRMWWRALMAPYAAALLRTYLPRTDGMMTVAPGIASWYASAYGVDPVVVTNAPPAADLRPTVVGDPIRLIHHGGVDPQRRLELMIEAVDECAGRLELDLMLVPNRTRYFERLQSMVRARPWVKLIEPRPQREIVAACNTYDVGVHLLPPGNQNLLHALPNKLFEFIQARLAIAIGPSPEMARVVRDHGCGVVADAFTAEAFADVLVGLTPDRVRNYKKRADRAAGQLSAERNRELVLTLVDGVLGHAPS